MKISFSLRVLSQILLRKCSYSDVSFSENCENLFCCRTCFSVRCSRATGDILYSGCPYVDIYILFTYSESCQWKQIAQLCRSLEIIKYYIDIILQRTRRCWEVSLCQTICDTAVCQQTRLNK